MKWQTSEPPWGERRAADTASEGELWWREADGLEVFLFWRLVITTLRETGGGEERIITRAPSPSDRRVGGEKKWKSQISSTSWRGAMTGKAKHYYTFPLCGRSERTQRARRFLPPFVSELLSSFSSSLVSFHLFLFVFVCLCWYFLSFPSLQRSVCLPLPPPSLPPSLTWECVSRLLRPITTQNDKMEIIGVSQDQVKCNGPWKKSLRMLVCILLCVCVCAYTVWSPFVSVLVYF